MIQLAFNYKGERFTPPAAARFWRVRRLRAGQRGQLDVVRGADGRPLIVPIDVGVNDLRAAVGDRAGRYRLDVLDEGEMVMEDVEPAYLTVPGSDDGEGDDAPDVEAHDLPHRPAGGLRNAAGTTAPPMVAGSFGAMTGAEYLLGEALRGHVQMFQALTTALATQGAGAATGASQMMTAAAELLRAADGASMPRRAPVVAQASVVTPVAPGPVPAPRNSRDGGDSIEIDDTEGNDDSEDDDAADVSDADVMGRLMALADKVQGVVAPVADVARLVVGGFGGGQVPGDEAGDEDAESGAPDANGDAAGAPQPLMPAHLRTSHMIAIGYELGHDGARFRRIVAAMEPVDRRALTDHLCAMSLEDAVADMKAKLARISTGRTSVPSTGGGAGAAEAWESHASVPVEIVEPLMVIVEETPSAHAAGEATIGSEESAIAAASDAASTECAPDEAGDDGAPDAPARTLATARPTSPTGPNAAPADAQTGADAQTQMLQIARHLSMAEILKVQRLAASLAAPERAAWLARLAALSPKQAAKVIRAELAAR